MGGDGRKLPKYGGLQALFRKSPSLLNELITELSVMFEGKETRQRIGWPIGAAEDVAI